MDDAHEAVRKKGKEVAQESVALHRLRCQIAELKSRERYLQNQLAEADERFDALAAISDPGAAPKIRPCSRKRREATAILMASDWHVEEHVDPVTINGRNEYNPEIAAVRAERFFQGCTWLVNALGPKILVKDGVLWLGGDMVSGYIHEELVESNHLSPTEAILLAQRLIIAGIDYVLRSSSIERLIVVCNYGNHGRTTKKRRVSTGAKNSFEWLMYQVLAQHYKGNKQVRFVVADGGHAYLDIYNLKVRFMHGDDIRYYGGVGGLTVPLRKAIDAWNQNIHADLTVFGHWHQLRDYGDAVGNGSLIGWNAYAQSVKARHEPARQGFFLIDKNRGKTLFSPIWVED